MTLKYKNSRNINNKQIMSTTYIHVLCMYSVPKYIHAVYIDFQSSIYLNKKKIKSREGAETFRNIHVHILYIQFYDLIYYM